MVAAVFLGADIIRRAIRIFTGAKKEAAIQAELRRLTKKVQPAITVLVYGKKKDRATETTIESVQASDYDRVDVAVAYTSLPLARSYLAAYRRSKRGEIVVCLKAGDVLDTLFLKRAILKQDNRKRWWVPVKQLHNSSEITGIAKDLQDALWGDTVSIEVCTRQALMMSRPILRRAPSAAVVVATLLIAGVCLSVAYIGLQALWYIWLLFTPYLFMVLWLEARGPISKMLKTSLGVPSALFFVPISSLVEGFFQLTARK